MSGEQHTRAVFSQTKSRVGGGAPGGGEVKYLPVGNRSRSQGRSRAQSSVDGLVGVGSTEADGTPLPSILLPPLPPPTRLRPMPPPNVSERTPAATNVVGSQSDVHISEELAEAARLGYEQAQIADNEAKRRDSTVETVRSDSNSDFTPYSSPIGVNVPIGGSGVQRRNQDSNFEMEPLLETHQPPSIAVMKDTSESKPGSSWLSRKINGIKTWWNRPKKSETRSQIQREQSGGGVELKKGAANKIAKVNLRRTSFSPTNRQQVTPVPAQPQRTFPSPLSRSLLTGRKANFLDSPVVTTSPSVAPPNSATLPSYRRTSSLGRSPSLQQQTTPAFLPVPQSGPLPAREGSTNIPMPAQSPLLIAGRRSSSTVELLLASDSESESPGTTENKTQAQGSLVVPRGESSQSLGTLRAVQGEDKDANRPEDSGEESDTKSLVRGESSFAGTVLPRSDSDSDQPSVSLSAVRAWLRERWNSIATRWRNWIKPQPQPIRLQSAVGKRYPVRKNWPGTQAVAVGPSTQGRPGPKANVQVVPPVTASPPAVESKSVVPPSPAIIPAPVSPATLTATPDPDYDDLLKAFIRAVNAMDSENKPWTKEREDSPPTWVYTQSPLRVSVEKDSGKGVLKLSPTKPAELKTEDHFKTYFSSMFEVMARTGKVFNVREDNLKSMLSDLTRVSGAEQDLILKGLKDAMEVKSRAGGKSWFEECFNSKTQAIFTAQVASLSASSSVPPQSAAPMLPQQPPNPSIPAQGTGLLSPTN